MGSEQEARKSVDRLLAAAGWAVQDFKAADIYDARGVAQREFALNDEFGFVACFLSADGGAAEGIGATSQDPTLVGSTASFGWHVWVSTGTCRTCDDQCLARVQVA